MVMFGCNSILIVFGLYSAIYVNSNIYQKSIYVAYLLLNLFYVVFFSHTIGLVDLSAKVLSDHIYKAFIITRTNKFTKYFYWQVIGCLFSQFSNWGCIRIASTLLPIDVEFHY